MRKAMKSDIMALLYGDHFPVSDMVVSEDPEFIQVCQELESLILQIKIYHSKEEYDRALDLMALQELAGGYQNLEYFHAGLLTGFDLCDTMKDNKTKLIIRNLIR